MSNNTQEMAQDLIIEKMLDEINFKALKPESVFSLKGNSLLKGLEKRFLERALEAEMTAHLGYEKSDKSGNNSGNSRNGYIEKKIITDSNEEFQIKVPRDRAGTFEPIAVPKHEKRPRIFGSQIISMYANGMTTREIQQHLEKVYGIEISRELISNITDEVLEDVHEWQNRPLERAYPIIFLMH